ncbi:unnamed protein product [Phytophthora lilii]|uniref:Unnamed protein product n=1 Tax=Phytophthora lilii TaxID=2077276 RepID=A0A9W6TVY2_9STRA|nr:unnamed protein product [Phytophthora lilii]
MKLSNLVSALVAAKMYLVAAQTENNSTSANACFEPCEGFGEYCEVSTGVCRGPAYDGECFNPATGVYQDGCDDGFECIDNKCDFAQEETEADSNSQAGCGVQCDVFEEYCDSTLDECRAPSYDGECYNAIASVFQDGCEQGYECIDNVCQVITTAPTDNAVCYLICSAGNYCENGTDECRGPNYDGECFNPATGLYQNGCDPGFTCMDNKCEYA